MEFHLFNSTAPPSFPSENISSVLHLQKAYNQLSWSNCKDWERTISHYCYFSHFVHYVRRHTMMTHSILLDSYWKLWWWIELGILITQTSTLPCCPIQWLLQLTYWHATLALKNIQEWFRQCYFKGHVYSHRYVADKRLWSYLVAAAYGPTFGSALFCQLREGQSALLRDQLFFHWDGGHALETDTYIP